MRQIVCLILASAALAAPSLAHAAAGDLDPTWGGTGGEIPGTIANDFGSDLEDEGFAVAIQPDGKIVVAGYANGHFAVTRYNADGSLDPHFGGSGVNETPGTTEIPPSCVSKPPSLAPSRDNGSARSIVIQPDGKILVAGYEEGPDCEGLRFALMRFKADGSLDTSFGGPDSDPATADDDPGTVTKDVTDGRDDFSRGFSVLLQPATNAAGFKIVVVGENHQQVEGYVTDFALARFNPDGTPDETFAENEREEGLPGTRTTNFRGRCYRSEEAYAGALQADGKIIAVGYGQLSDSYFDPGLGHGVYPGTAFALARYNTDGTLDTTFNPDATDDPSECKPKKGTVETELSALKDDEAHAVVVQPDGHILVAGFTTSDDDHRHFAIVRYNANGTVDTTWGTEGHVFTDFADTDAEANAIVLQADGKFLVAGSTYHDDTSTQTRISDFAMARYNADGTLDSTFGTGGKVTTQFAGDGKSFVQAMLLQPDDGKIVLAGYRSHSPADFAVARYLTDPKPKPTPTPTTPTPVVVQVPSSNPPASCGDTTPPVVSISSNQNRTLYAKGRLASVKVVATDNGRLTKDPSNVSQRVSTRKAGRFTVTATATDMCGNSTSRSFHYRVVSGPTIRIVSPSSCVRSSVTASVRITGGAALRHVVVTIAGKRVYVGRKSKIRVSAETSLMSANRHGIAVYIRDAAGHRRHLFARFSVCPPPKALFTG